MNSQELQESGQSADLSQPLKPRKRGRPKGSKTKRQNGSPTAKLSGVAGDVDTKAADFHNAIYSMHLSNVRPKVIAERTGVHVETVRSVIRLGDKTLSAENRFFLMGIVRACFIKTINHHNTLADEYGVAFVTTQLARNKLKPGSKDCLAHDARLRLIGRELTATNKAFVELLCRMGVPHAPTDPEKGSHTPGSGDVIFADSLYNKLSVEDAEVLAIETAEKQLTYLKGQKKKREKEQDES